MIKTSRILRAADDSQDVHVIGYGIVSLGQAKAKIRNYIEQMQACLDKADYMGLGHFAFSNGVLKAFIQAVQKAEDSHTASTHAAISPSDYRREDIPVEVITDKREAFPDLAAAKQKYPDLDLFHNGQNFTWAMYGEDSSTGQIMARFESWPAYKALSQ